jgi:hypothetical protein
MDTYTIITHTGPSPQPHPLFWLGVTCILFVLVWLAWEGIKSFFRVDQTKLIEAMRAQIAAQQKLIEDLKRQHDFALERLEIANRTRTSLLLR